MKSKKICLHEKDQSKDSLIKYLEGLKHISITEKENEEAWVKKKRYIKSFRKTLNK